GAKGHLKQVLEEMEGRGKLPEQQREVKNVGNVTGGHPVRVLFGSFLVRHIE
ncbi:hypothetical protein OG21DRAFT_1403194, partial [Imleria badia]